MEFQGIFPRYLHVDSPGSSVQKLQGNPHIPARLGFWSLWSLTRNHLRLVGVLETAFLGIVSALLMTAILTQGTPAQQYAVLVHSLAPLPTSCLFLLIAVIRSLTYRLFKSGPSPFWSDAFGWECRYDEDPVAAVAARKATWVL